MIEFIGKFDDNVSSNLNKRFYKKYWWAYAIFSILFILIGISGIIFREDRSDLYAGIFIIAFGVLFTPLTMTLTHFMQKRFNRSMSILSPDTVETFRFFADRIEIIQKKGDEYVSTTSARYSYLYMVEETKDRYFLRISKSQSHVVNKADLTQGSIAELNVILHANLGNRFKSNDR